MMKEITFKLYSRRWVFIAGIFLLNFLAGISFASFGQISIFFVDFFGTSHVAVDWITNARFLSGVFSTIPMAWFVFKGKVGLRSMILLIVFCLTLGFSLITASLGHTSLIALTVFGQILTGVAATFTMIIPSSFAVLWFPENQVGTAIALSFFGNQFGDGAGFLLPPFLVFSEDFNANSSFHLNPTEIDSAQRRLLVLYGSFSVLSLVLAVLFAAFITDKPPMPPTIAQALQEPKDISLNFQDFLHQTKILFKNPSYVIICVVIGITIQLLVLENLMMPEVIGAAIPHIDTAPGVFVLDQHPNVLSGYIMSTFSLGGVLGLVVGGKVVDSCKKYKLIAIIGTAAICLSTVSILFSIKYKYPPIIYLSNAFFGFCTGLTEVVLFEMATQLTYPTDETLVNTWMTGVQTFLALMLGIVGRIVFDATGVLGVLLFQCGCALLSVILICFVSSTNRRLTMQEKNVNNNKTSEEGARKNDVAIT